MTRGRAAYKNWSASFVSLLQRHLIELDAGQLGRQAGRQAGYAETIDADPNGTYLRGSPLINMNFFANIIAQI